MRVEGEGVGRETKTRETVKVSTMRCDPKTRIANVESTFRETAKLVEGRDSLRVVNVAKTASMASLGQTWCREREKKTEERNRIYRRIGMRRHERRRILNTKAA